MTREYIEVFVYILDNDVFSLYYTRRQEAPLFQQRLREANARNELYISIVVAHESLRGALALTNRHISTDRVVAAFDVLAKVLRSISGHRILPITEAVHNSLQTIPNNIRQRIGPRDALIAATALSLNYFVVTRNRVDFEQVNELHCVDWTRP